MCSKSSISQVSCKLEYPKNPNQMPPPCPLYTFASVAQRKKKCSHDMPSWNDFQHQLGLKHSHPHLGTGVRPLADFAFPFLETRERRGYSCPCRKRRQKMPMLKQTKKGARKKKQEQPQVQNNLALPAATRRCPRVPFIFLINASFPKHPGKLKLSL